MSDINPNIKPTPGGLHPMLWLAAGAVTVCALAGTAYFTGLLPRHDAPPPPLVATVPAPPAVTPTPPEVAATPPVPAPVATPAPAASKPASKPVVKPHPVRRDNSQEYSSRDARERVPYPAYGNRDDGSTAYPDNGRSYNSQPAYCRECGTIESVRSVVREGEGSGLGAVAGGVVGGALGNGVGQGTGRDLATIAGVIGGAVLGNKVEKSQRQTLSYQITVRFEDGSSRTFVSERETAWQAGDRVKVINGQIIPR